MKLRYIHTEKRPGARRYAYFRRGHGPRIALPDLPHDHPEFLRAYAAALEVQPGKVRKSRAALGSIGAVIEIALDSARFHAASASYRAMLRRHLDAINEAVGAAPAAGVKERHVRQNVAKAENQVDRLKAWRFWARAAIEAGTLDRNAVTDVKLPSAGGGDGHEPWTADDIAKFRARWPVGTVPRAAMELLLWTGARIGDAVLIGPQMVRDGVLTYRQGKTGGAAHCPWTCALPAYARGMEGDRKAMLAAIAHLSGHLTFLPAEGRTRSAKGLGTMIRESAMAAGLTNRSAHGLRKSRAVALAEAGATTHQIVAWTGHKTLKEAERYTVAANRRNAVIGTEGEQDLPN